MKLLAEAIPDLKRYGDKVEVWSELILGQPLAITGSTVKRSPTKYTAKNKEESQPDAHRLSFTIRDVVISLAIRIPAKSAAWTPYAEFRFGIAQQASVSVLQPDFKTRKLRMDWTGKPRMTVSGRFAPNYRPENPRIDTEKIRRLFADAWNAWTESGPAARADVPDLEFGISSLRLDSVGWSDPFLSFTLASPGLKITNGTDKPLVYQAKGPNSGWSSPLTIPPNDSHEFEIAHEMLYRSTAGGRTLLFTLPAGSHSVYRAPRGGGSPRLFKARSSPPAKKKE